MNKQNLTASIRNEIPRRTGLTFQHFSTACREMLEDLKNRTVNRLAAEFANLDSRLVKRAVNEAWAIAYLSPVPHLVLPTLAEEKVQKLREWTLRQRAIFQNQRAPKVWEAVERVPTFRHRAFFLNQRTALAA